MSQKPVCVTFGIFDGVHLGHVALLKHLKNLIPHTSTVAMTFDPHPSCILAPEHSKPLLQSLSQRVENLLEQVDSVVVVPFTKDFAALSAHDFCQKILQSTFNVKGLVMGHDLHYGRDRQGDMNHMMAFGQAAGWVVEQGPLKRHHQDIVSSSKIRHFLQDGRIEEGTSLLGHPFTLRGVVVRGAQRGRTLGFPTANLGFTKGPEQILRPATGVYACSVTLAGFPPNLPAVMNCGFRPTIDKNLEKQIEAHILNFDADIYDHPVDFTIHHFLRQEKKFANLDELKDQIAKDTQQAEEYFFPQSVTKAQKYAP